MLQTIKTLAMKFHTARILKSIDRKLAQMGTDRMLRRLDLEIFKLEVIATNTARSIASADRVIEAIDNGSMR